MKSTKNLNMSLKNKLSKQDLELLEAFSQSCRHSILQMVTNAQSGHPGGSLGMIDYLTLLYTQIIGQTGEKLIVSNGHVSPAVYAVLAEMGYTNKKEAVVGFRKIGKVYEGHVTRHVPGVWYGTGPLGAGISAAAGFALGEKLKGSGEKVFATVGDGESQEGQVYETMNFAAKYKLDNFIVFMDHNQVQLTDSLEEIMPIHPGEQWKAAGWKVIEVKGHDFKDIWRGLQEAYKPKIQPVLLLGHTIMGQGVDFMQETGEKYEATWHGKAPKPEDAAAALQQLATNNEQRATISDFLKTIKWKPSKPSFPEPLTKVNIKTGKPKLYPADELTDCRSAYGNALLDLAKANKNVVALTADLAGSVKTDVVKKELPDQHIECGVAEQHMVSCSGGLSLNDFVPFCSTFGAFMTSRAKDQARVNDINMANVKMVATHCGLSVGEDGPTHQAIDDMGSMLGFFNTMVIEPADPNQCDRIIRYVASHYGNFYVRMGRHKIPVLINENGQPFFGKDYQYEYGRCDVLHKGTKLTVVASGPMVAETVEAYNLLKSDRLHTKVEIVIATSPKKFDDRLVNSIKKTKNVLVVEDHNVYSGFGDQIASLIVEKGFSVKNFAKMGVEEYQLSGTSKDLYNASGISAKHIARKCAKILDK
jgi:transketolase